MNREIKFRIWHHRDKYMIESAQSVSTLLGKYLMGWGDGMQNGNYSLDGNDYTFMQYTGLKDKNGTEIYEGDKVFNKSWNPDTMEVRFYDGAFMLYFEGREPYFVDGYYAEEFEVIGNIHENPELL